MPLALFAYGARALPLSTLGFIQYLSPSLQFLLAVLLYGEPFTPAHGVTFACIWTALALLTWDAQRGYDGRWPLPPERASRRTVGSPAGGYFFAA